MSRFLGFEIGQACANVRRRDAHAFETPCRCAEDTGGEMGRSARIDDDSADAALSQTETVGLQRGDERCGVVAGAPRLQGRPTHIVQRDVRTVLDQAFRRGQRCDGSRRPSGA
ncbi:hypothetical protein [Methylobacterium sp. WL116]|uniref:hypothetical protein n=1 Tax=Methylobacterium sp. WL116 TaxID=2603889 RepID=UPI00164F8A12|nr:hypothetical protein [Methylobacterium sp. WL116]